MVNQFHTTNNRSLRHSVAIQLCQCRLLLDYHRENSEVTFHLAGHEPTLYLRRDDVHSSALQG
jgi:hypothetical protein